MKKLLVFTDLDGSLLDHNNYQWQEALPALQRLAKQHIPVIINSSKTAAEILQLKRQLENPYPFIAENGAVAYLPSHLTQVPSMETDFKGHFFARPYQKIIGTLSQIRQKTGFSFRGFSDMDVKELADVCDLDIESARDAKARAATEPLLWRDSEDALVEFESLIRKHDLDIVKGGRFYHVMSKVDKGKTLRWVMEQYQQVWPDAQLASIGVGDSFNDVAMLEAVEYPVLIRNATIKQPDLPELKNLYRTRSEGPAGWNESIIHLLEIINEGAMQ